MTTYVVLQQWQASDDGEGGGQIAYLVRSTVDARSPEHAITEHLGQSDTGGTFVAVPAKSWKPITVEVERVSRVKIVEES